MKSKEQKRREAIERLERSPRNPRLTDEQRQATWARRLEEAARLRRAFGYGRAVSEEVTRG